MIDHMLGYKPPGNTDEAGFQKKVLAAIKSLEEACIIKPVTGTRRYVIYGVITSILSAERIAALDARYKALALLPVLTVARQEPGQPGCRIRHRRDQRPGPGR